MASNDDIPSRIAALEVYVEEHGKALDSLQETIKDIYNKSGDQSKDLTSAIVQLKGVVSQFSEISVKVKELEDELVGIPDVLKQHVSDCASWREKNNLFSFMKNNPGLSIQILVVGGCVILGALLLSGHPAIISALKALIGLFGIL